MRLTRTLVPAAVAAMLVLSGCGSSGDTAATSATGSDGSGAALPASYGDCTVSGTRGEFSLTTLKKGQLLVKADLPSPGWYNGDTVEKIRSGFDFCLLVNMAYRAGIDDVKLQNTSFDGLVAGKAGDFDLSLNQITITDERKQVMDFSDPYFQSTAAVLVKKGSDVSQTNLRDSTLGVKQGTVGQSLVADTIKPSHDPSVFPGDPELQAAVASGRVDAGIQDLSIMLGAAASSNGKLVVAGQIETGESYGVMMAKGSPNLAVVNEMLAQMKADGTLDRLSAAYLTDAYGIDPATVPVWKVS